MGFKAAVSAKPTQVTSCMTSAPLPHRGRERWQQGRGPFAAVPACPAIGMQVQEIRPEGLHTRVNEGASEKDFNGFITAMATRGIGRPAPKRRDITRTSNAGGEGCNLTELVLNSELFRLGYVS